MKRTFSAPLLIAVSSIVVYGLACSTHTPIGAVDPGGSAGANPGLAGMGSAGTINGSAGAGPLGGDAGAGAGDGTAGAGNGTAGAGNGTAGAGAGGATGGDAGAGSTCLPATASGGVYLAPVKVTTKVNSSPAVLSIGDLNGDGIADVVIGGRHYDPNPVSGTAGATGSAPGTVSVWFGDKVKSPAASVAYTGGAPVASAIGDLDGDGKLDVAFIPDYNGTDSAVQVALNEGAGALDAPTGYDVSTGSRQLAVADLDGDGKAELIFPASADPGGVVVLKLAAKKVYAPSRYDDGFMATNVATGDLDGDGKIDVVVAGPAGVHVLINDGAGHLQKVASYGAAVYQMSIADLDGDGKNDILENGSVLTNLGGGAFSVPRALGLADVPTFGDLNGDGKPDAVTLTYGCSTLSVTLNDGSGGFGGPTVYAVDGQPQLVALADLNGDGATDIVFTDSTSVNVLFHRAP